MPFRTSIQIILSTIAILIAILCILYYFGSKDIVLEKKKIIEKIPVEKLNIVKEEMVQIKKEVGEQKFEKGNYERAAKMFEEMSIANQFEDFLTVPAYNEIVKSEAR